MVLACYYGQPDCVILLLAALGRTDLNKAYPTPGWSVSLALLACALSTLKIALTSLLTSYKTISYSKAQHKEFGVSLEVTQPSSVKAY